MEVYFHSDDAGITPGNCETIIYAHEQGYIDGFSILANRKTAPILRNYFSLVKKPAGRIAVHLNLSDGLPISDPSGIPMLLDKQGELGVSFIKAFFICLLGGENKRAFLSQVALEWDNQIKFVKGLVGNNSILFLDGHNHIHMVPHLFTISLQLCRQHEIKSIRVSKEKFHFSKLLEENFSSFFFLNLLKHWLLNCLSFVCKPSNGITASGSQVAGVLYSGHMTANVVEALLEMARKIPAGELEIIFHIGHADENSLKEWTMHKAMIEYSISQNRQMELQTVKMKSFGK
jgi:predicted glycoside hydrolase/deacetylase ChbG (UPF0249 family)